MNNSDSKKQNSLELMAMATEIVSAYVSNNNIPASNIAEVFASVYQSLCHLENSDPITTRDEHLKPFVPIKKSITDDYIICLEDGKKLKMMKRHLRTAYNLSPEEYRAKWGLPANYPMVAPNYAKRRSEFAKDIGLGKSGRGGRRKKLRAA